MKSTSRKRTLLISSAVILLCMTIIVGMTFALFTDTQKVRNHLQAGDLAITLKRTELLKTTLNTGGYLVTPEKPDQTVVNFSNPTDENVFGLTTDGEGNVTEKIVPGSKFVATLQIENNSDVAFGYWVKIVCDDDYVTKTLAEQLIITVYTDQNDDGVIDIEGDDAEKNESVVAKGLEVGSDSDTGYIGKLGIGDVEAFVVSVEFDDKGYTYENGKLESANDGAQTQTVEFDLVVYAVQLKDAPATPQE